MRAIGRTDAGTYITKLPKAEHSAPEWQVATGAVAGSETRDSPTMLAQIRVVRALNRDVSAPAASRPSDKG